jgi:hypothetical protein
MSYGEGYDWDHVKVHTVRALGGRICKAAEMLGVDGFDRELDQMRRRLTGAPPQWRDGGR